MGDPASSSAVTSQEEGGGETAAAASAAAVNTTDSDEFVARPGPHDVLMGRGAPMSEHEGNANLRKIVLERHADYADPNKQRPGKHQVALEIVHKVIQRGGRFLRKTESDEWQVVKNQKEILRKVKQLLRDMGPEARQKRAERHLMRAKGTTATKQASQNTATDGSASSDALVEQAILHPPQPALPSLLAMQAASRSVGNTSRTGRNFRPLSLRQSLALPQAMESAPVASVARQTSLNSPIFGGTHIPATASLLNVPSWQLELDQLRAAPSATSRSLETFPTSERLLAAAAMQERTNPSTASGLPSFFMANQSSRSSTGLIPPTAAATSSLFGSNLPPADARISEALAVHNLEAQRLRQHQQQQQGMSSLSSAALASTTSPSLALLAQQGLLHRQQMLEELLYQERIAQQSSALREMIRSLQEPSLQTPNPSPARDNDRSDKPPGGNQGTRRI